MDLYNIALIVYNRTDNVW